MLRIFSHLKNACRAVPLAYPLGHYYSPICNPRESLIYYRDPDHAAVQTMPGVDLCKDTQLGRLASWLPFIREIRWKRYNPMNGLYNHSDAICLHSMIREYSPRRIVEIGCGNSSNCCLDTIETLGLPTSCTFIDPTPQLPIDVDQDGPHRFLRQQVQSTDRDVFADLLCGDVLIINSSHVVKTGSDIAFELFEILPLLKPGVLIHFHDIFFPFEYPRRWAIDENWSWNEIYIVRALLMYSTRFRIEFWNNYLVKIAPEAFVECPTIAHPSGASLWLSVVP